MLPATCTCLTQAGARASNTFWHPILGVDSRSETTDCRPTGDGGPTDCPPQATDWRPKGRREGCAKQKRSERMPQSEVIKPKN